MKIQSKMKMLSSRQYFPNSMKSMRPIRVVNSNANSPNWAQMEYVRDFMHVLNICKFAEDPIRNEVSISGTTFSPLHVYGRLKGK